MLLYVKSNGFVKFFIRERLEPLVSLILREIGPTTETDRFTTDGVINAEQLRVATANADNKKSHSGSKLLYWD
jgi:hypothetical protein